MAFARKCKWQIEHFKFEIIRCLLDNRVMDHIIYLPQLARNMDVGTFCRGTSTRSACTSLANSMPITRRI